jgi:hypothetical protein
MNEVAELVSEKSETLIHDTRSVVRQELVALTPELRDGVRDGFVKTSVEDAELIRGHYDVLFGGCFGHRLTEVAIVVDDLINGESGSK